MQSKKHNPASGFFGKSALLLAVKLFPAIAAFAVGIVYSSWLTPYQYGAYQQFWIMLATISAFAGIGLAGFLITFSHEDALHFFRSLSRRNLLVIGVLALLFAGIFTALQSSAGLLSPGATFAFFLCYIGCLVTDSMLIVGDKTPIAALLNLIYATLFCVIHFWHSSPDLNQVFIGLTILLVLRFAVGLVLSLRVMRAKNISSLAGLQPANHIRAWMHFALNDIILVLFRWTDKFILAFFLTNEVYAVYVNATVEIAFLPLIFSAVSSAAIRHWSSAMPGAQNDEVQILHVSSRMLSAMVFPLFAFLMFFPDVFLVTLFSEKYRAGTGIFLCAQLILPFRAYPFTALLQSRRRADIVNKGAVVDFVSACLLMYPLYLLWDLEGVALAFIFSNIWQGYYYLTQTAKVSGKSVGTLVPVKMLASRLALCGAVFGLLRLGLMQTAIPVKMQFVCGCLSMVVLFGGFMLRERKRADKA